MKKILLTIALVVMGTTAAFAQVSVYAGYEQSKYTHTYTSTNISGTDYSNNVFVGAMYNFELAKGLGLETGAYLYMGGMNEENSKYSESSISIPFDFNYYIPITNNISFCPFAGCSLSYGLSSKTTTTLGAISTTTDWYKDTYDRFDINAEIGLGVNFCEHYNIYVDVYRGLLNTINVDSITEVDSGIEIGIGYSF